MLRKSVSLSNISRLVINHVISISFISFYSNNYYYYNKYKLLLKNNAITRDFGYIILY